MKKIIIAEILVALAFLGGYFLAVRLNQIPDQNILTFFKRPDRTLDKYAIENLSSAKYQLGTFEIKNQISKDTKFTSYLFDFSFVPDVTGSKTKVTSGIINIPDTDKNKYPLVILVRGYVDQNIYSSGMGSKNIGQYLSENDYVTIAPDFLGYAESDQESSNIFESRFQTYVTVVSLIKSINGGILNKYWDGKNVFIWAHSNGGQIALTTLEITGVDYPTVLWAPVSKPFPYSVLYYTDESDDGGKLIRKELSKFESLYNVDKYSLTNYLDRINAPIQLHQGTSDDAVPVAWSDTLDTKLKKLDKNIDYIVHPGADHNMQPDWNNAAKQTLKFYEDHLN